MVKIRDLHYAYRRKQVFNGLDLDLQAGHIYGLLGKNGTGKSTLLRNLSGHLYPRQGRISVSGLEPRKRQPAFLQQVFLLPEEFYLPSLTINQWVRYNAPFYPTFSHELFNRTITDFEIPAGARLDEMSYGQQKKALICFAIATNSALLLMDEPTNGLDIVSKSQFRKVIAGVVDGQRCILISTHQVRDLENLIDNVTIIDEGKILFSQPMDVISRTLRFKLSFDPAEGEQALYSERSLQGTAVVLENPDQEDSRPDLELLYKAILMNREKVNKLFLPKKIMQL